MVRSTGRYGDQPYFDAERTVKSSGGLTESVHKGQRKPDHQERDSVGRSELQAKESAEAEARLKCPPVIQRSCELDYRDKSKLRAIDYSPQYLAFRRQVAADLGNAFCSRLLTYCIGLS